VGWRPDLQEEIQDAEKPEARWHGCWDFQKAHLEVYHLKRAALASDNTYTGLRSVLPLSAGGARAQYRRENASLMFVRSRRDSRRSCERGCGRRPEGGRDGGRFGICSQTRGVLGWCCISFLLRT